MTPILRQFLTESRDFLQAIAQQLMRLEKTPDDADLMSDLFRSVHTLKGNSGLFEFPEMSRVLHAAEDLMSAVRDGGVAYSQELADRLLDAMDFVGQLLDEIEGERGTAGHATASARLAESLRQWIAAPAGGASDAGAAGATVAGAATGVPAAAAPSGAAGDALQLPLEEILPAVLAEWRAAARAGEVRHWIRFVPESECFFKGEDPFHQARQTPLLVWQRVSAETSWPALAELDPYQCHLRFDMVTTASRAAIDEHYRYVPEQVVIVPLTAARLAPPSALPGPVAQAIIEAQRTALGMPDRAAGLPGRLTAIAAALEGCYRSCGCEDRVEGLKAALAAALQANSAAPLREWLTPGSRTAAGEAVSGTATGGAAPGAGAAAGGTGPGGAVLKVDQDKIDRLMNLIGEMVVAKNGLPFLAGRAESVYGSRELSREIKAQYAVINRIAEEMQDAIMQVRMTPVSTILQRFPRLVRDLSRKLGKEVALNLEGEQTEADKNIIEALADPLIHIVRNSLDHGLETPDVRRAAGKSPEGHLSIRASQDSGRVHIDISDDGKGIDPAMIRRKALDKGIIESAAAERLTDQEAVNLVFAAGFSTAETVSDLSGRGVGMDVVRTAVERINGTVTLRSRVGEGTNIRLSLPLSMAVTNVMVIESNQQFFGVPMDMVLETVRVPRGDIRSIKNRQTTVLRDRVLPLRSLNELLAGHSPQRTNEHDELATLVVQIHGEPLGLMVDDFREVVDIILKPMGGILGAVPGYSGSALMGDGSVLMVLNPKELVTWQ